MKKTWSIIFSVLGIAFLAITILKYSPESEQKNREEATHQKSFNENEKVVEFWELYNKATDFRFGGDFQKAAEYYRRALQKNPEHLNAIYYLGSMELAMEHFERAEKRWNSLIEINRASARGHVQLGTIYSCRQPDNPLFNLPKAARHFAKASSLNREITGPMLQLAKIDILNRRFDDAEERLKEVTQSNFRSLVGHFLLGYLAWKAGRESEAKDYLDKSLSIAEGSEEFANVGEGATNSGDEAPVLNRCALVTPEIQTIMNRYLTNSSYSSADIFEAFENEI